MQIIKYQVNVNQIHIKCHHIHHFDAYSYHILLVVVHHNDLFQFPSYQSTNCRSIYTINRIWYESASKWYIWWIWCVWLIFTSYLIICIIRCDMLCFTLNIFYIYISSISNWIQKYLIYIWWLILIDAVYINCFIHHNTYIICT